MVVAAATGVVTNLGHLPSFASGVERLLYSMLFPNLGNLFLSSLLLLLYYCDVHARMRSAHPSAPIACTRPGDWRSHCATVVWCDPVAHHAPKTTRRRFSLGADEAVRIFGRSGTTSPSPWERKMFGENPRFCTPTDLRVLFGGGEGTLTSVQVVSETTPCRWGEKREKSNSCKSLGGGFLGDGFGSL